MPSSKSRSSEGRMPGPHRGRGAIQAILEDQREAFDAWIIEVEQVFDSGDQVVALIKRRLRPKGTDAEFEIRNGHIWAIRDGVTLSLRGFPNPEEALEARRPSGVGDVGGCRRASSYLRQEGGETQVRSL